MNYDTLQDWLGKHFSFATIENGVDFVTLTIKTDLLFDALAELKTNFESRFDYLFCLTAIDRLQHFEVVYHLSSTIFKHTIVVKTLLVDREFPQVDSVVSLWKSAELYECEIFDLFGIKFTNHNCRRLFMPNDWVGYPLRKDYSDDVNVLKL